MKGILDLSKTNLLLVLDLFFGKQVFFFFSKGIIGVGEGLSDLYKLTLYRVTGVVKEDCRIYVNIISRLIFCVPFSR